MAETRPSWFARSSEDALDADAVTEALESLEGTDREVVIARVWGGLSFTQIGQLIGASDSTAHRRYEAALGKLRKAMGVPCPKRK